MRMAFYKSVLLLSLALVATGAADAGNKDSKAMKPKTKMTQTISEAVFKRMTLAQKDFDAKDYKAAQADLDALHATFDKLNDYEKATLWNLYAAIFRSMDDNKRAVEAYANVLNQKNLPEGLRDSALFSLSQTYFLMEDYKRSIAVLKKWISVVEDVQPDAYVLLAQAYYQLQQYQNAKEPLVKAMALARDRKEPWKESWLGLLRAVFYELKDYPSATQIMEVLASQYPRDTYFQQLSGLYGLQGDQRKQLQILYVAYLNGFVTNPSDILNVARLCMAQNAPERAVDVLNASMKSKALDANVENLQLLAQAMSMARDTKASVPVLTKLAGMSGLAKHYAYLGQAYSDLNDWSNAAVSFNKALAAKELTNVAAIQLQLATALFNGGHLKQAREAFVAASSSPAQRDVAVNWIKFIDNHIQRDEALRANAH